MFNALDRKRTLPIVAWYMCHIVSIAAAVPFDQPASCPDLNPDLSDLRNAWEVNSETLGPWRSERRKNKGMPYVSFLRNSVCSCLAWSPVQGNCCSRAGMQVWRSIETDHSSVQLGLHQTFKNCQGPDQPGQKYSEVEFELACPFATTDWKIYFVATPLSAPRL